MKIRDIFCKKIKLGMKKLENFMSAITSITKEEELHIKYSGNLNQIDVNTLFDSIIPFTSVIQEIGNEINPDTQLKIMIKAPEKGSFIIIMTFAQTVIDTLFNTQTLVTVSSVVTIISGMISIRKFLKGEKPSKVIENNHGVIIEDGTGKKITVDNRSYKITINNNCVNDSLDKIFNTLNNDTAIDAFKILDQNDKKMLSVEKKEFIDVSKSIHIKVDEEKKEIVNETLIIFKVVFEEKYKWEFYRGEYKINALIEDKTFYNKINSGETFAKGDRLEVEMEITKIFDQSMQEYLPKSYIIKKVKGHTKPNKAEQMELIR